MSNVSKRSNISLGLAFICVWLVSSIGTAIYCRPNTTMANTHNISANVGDTNPFSDNMYLVSDSDKQDVYYKSGVYYVIRDDIVRQKQEYIVVPRDMSIINYLKTYPDFSQEIATISCTNMDGSDCIFDLSTPWELCDFEEMVIYWKRSDNHGTLLVLYPDSASVSTEYLYYSELADDMGVDTSDYDD